MGFLLDRVKEVHDGMGVCEMEMWEGGVKASVSGQKRLEERMGN